MHKFLRTLFIAFAAVSLVFCTPVAETEEETGQEILRIGSIAEIDSTLTSYQELSGYVSGLDGFIYDDSLGCRKYEILEKVLDDFNVPVAPTADIDSLARLFHHAKVLMDSIIVLDTHCDFPEAAYYRPDRGYTIDESQSRCQVSIAKMDQGHASAQYLALWLNPRGVNQKDPDNVSEAPAELWKFLELTEKHLAGRADLCGVARSRDEILALKKQGKKAFLFGLENGFFAGDDLGIIKKLYDRGITYITLCHYGDNQICSSSNKSENPSVGLTEFGKEFVREMNRQGVVIDLSHTSFKTQRDVLELSTAPVVFTHSGASSVWKNPRNVDDETLRLLASKGGVIQIYLVQNFMGSGDTSKVGLKQMVDHIDYCVKLIGADHVGVGMDFDGGGGGVGFNGVNDAINLTMELLKLGYSDEDITAIWGENYLRVLSEVQSRRI